MKNNFVRRIKCVGMAMALFLSFTAVSYVAMPPQKVYAFTATSGTVVNGPARVRRSPVDGEHFSTLANGTIVNVVDEAAGSDGYTWYKVQFTYGTQSFEGYCRSDLIELSTVDTSIGSTVTDGTLSGRTGVVANTSTGVNVRNGAGTSYTVIKKVYAGQEVSINGQTTESSGRIWYNIGFTADGEQYAGWICADYVTVSAVSVEGTVTDADVAYIESLKAAGFPESYCTSLLELHLKYPNWQFVPVMTGLDWNTVIANESVVGKNLVQSSVNDSRKSTESTAYNWATDTWYGYDGDGWVSASSDFIAYCMDPRNYLNETYIFQFETLEYAPYQTASGVCNILANTFMAGNYTDTDGVTKSYADTFVSVGSGLGVSPYHLAARCKQEQGIKGTSQLISGKYTGYEGYYNYFNVGAYTTSAASSVVNGLIYAKKMGWNSIYGSIQGGSSVVADKYVKKGQNTIYFEKFNVVNTSNLYGHQYMTNVMAAISEGSSMAKAYTDKTAAFVFRIPVYSNMPETAVTFTDKGNPNNWLSSLTIDGQILTPGFNGATTEYSLIVDTSVSAINVAATAVSSKSTISGVGSYTLNYGTNVINVTCISQSGTSRTYTINVVRQQPPTVELGITTNYTIGENITGIAPESAASTVVSNISVTNGTVKVLKADGTENTGNVGTGDKVTIYDANGTVQKQYEVVVYGDINGDGKISNVDAVLMQKQILGMTNLTGAYAKASDPSKDGKVTNKDLVILQKHILSISTISQ